VYTKSHRRLLRHKNPQRSERNTAVTGLRAFRKNNLDDFGLAGRVLDAAVGSAAAFELAAHRIERFLHVLGGFDFAALEAPHVGFNQRPVFGGH
jgi:hypothetical protein